VGENLLWRFFYDDKITWPGRRGLHQARSRQRQHASARKNSLERIEPARTELGPILIIMQRSAHFAQGT
jgi:hypothetical protein